MNIDAPTLCAAVLEAAQDDPDRLFARLFFRDRPPIAITYGGLVERALAFAGAYRDAGVGHQDVVVIVLEHGPEVVYAFVGAQLVGAVPALFSFPSSKMPPDAYARMVAAQLEACASRHVVTSEKFAATLACVPALADRAQLLRAEVCAALGGAPAAPSEARPDDLCLLQHSSGTTGLKKGIALSHRVVLNQLRNLVDGIRLAPTDRLASWLPLYHDMGLIGCFLLPLAARVPVMLMSAFDWLLDPLAFFRIIQDERCTFSWLPNFAYNYYATRIPPERTQGLDLSSMRVFVNGAEPISARSHQLFLERYRAHGVRPEMLCTGYGMAENTLVVTIGGVREPLLVEEIDAEVFQREHRAVLACAGTRRRQEMVASGTCILNTQVRVVGASGEELPERCVGEILVHSDCLFSGYYRRPELDAAVLREGWYLSGDLGYLADGHLFVCGRKKDLIIVAGHNLYPQDVEEVVSAVPGVHPGRTVAFGVYDEVEATEALVVMAETDLVDPAEQRRLRQAISRALRDQLECAARHVVFQPHMTLLKSSAGKISRSANREQFIAQQGAKA